MTTLCQERGTAPWWHPDGPYDLLRLNNRHAWTGEELGELHLPLPTALCQQQIRVIAVADGDVKRPYWFAENCYIGRPPPDRPLHVDRPKRFLRYPPGRRPRPRHQSGVERGDRSIGLLRAFVTDFPCGSDAMNARRRWKKSVSFCASSGSYRLCATWHR